MYGYLNKVFVQNSLYTGLYLQDGKLNIPFVHFQLSHMSVRLKMWPRKVCLLHGWVPDCMCGWWGPGCMTGQHVARPAVPLGWVGARVRVWVLGCTMSLPTMWPGQVCLLDGWLADSMCGWWGPRCMTDQNVGSPAVPLGWVPECMCGLWAPGCHWPPCGPGQVCLLDGWVPDSMCPFWRAGCMTGGLL